MKLDPVTSLHRPEPTMPDFNPDPLPPDLPKPYRHPEGDPPEHRPPEHEPPGRKPPVHVPPAPSARVPACPGG